MRDPPLRITRAPANAKITSRDKRLAFAIFYLPKHGTVIRKILDPALENPYAVPYVVQMKESLG